MTAIEKLNRVLDKRRDIERIENRIAELESLATKATSVITGMPHGGKGDIADKWADLADYKNRYQESIHAFMNDSKELEEELTAIRKPAIRVAMQYRYVDCISPEAIAEKMCCDVRTVYRYLAKGKAVYIKLQED